MEHKIRVQFHPSVCGCPVFPCPLMHFWPPNMTWPHVWVEVWALSSALLDYVPVFLPVPCCLDILAFHSWNQQVWCLGIVFSISFGMLPLYSAILLKLLVPTLLCDIFRVFYICVMSSVLGHTFISSFPIWMPQFHFLSLCFWPELSILYWVEGESRHPEHFANFTKQAFTTKYGVICGFSCNIFVEVVSF